MGRWRPPPEKSSPYISAEGAEQLKEELKDLWTLRRRDVVPAITAAAAEGDRSENAEYIYRKKQLGEIDRKIRYITNRLEDVQVISQAPADPGRVFFGAWVEIRDKGNELYEYRIVGSDETDTVKRYISVDSPLARALLGCRAGDSVRVNLPEEISTYELTRVWYDD
jgi:transcription elongation factor GreB